jgi:D-alanyl-D-alanine-carboxypeptidase/D-alanyl-D-alanine-endopeptidase
MKLNGELDRWVYKRCMLRRSMLLASFSGLLAFISPLVFAQQKPNIAGEYAGSLGALHVKLHLKIDAEGALNGTLDSPDQGASGIPCADFHFDGHSLSFAVPAVHGTWKGTVGNQGALLTGIWNQGSPVPLNFSRDTFVSAAKPSAVDGIWLGTLRDGPKSLRIQLNVKSDVTGKEFCSNDSLDQGAMGLECANVLLEGNKFSFDIPVVSGHWGGTLSADGKTLTGTWNQGRPLPLNFEKQTVAISLPPVPPPTYDAAMAPVPAAELQAVLSKDLVQALTSGALAPSTGAGVTIGIVDHGEEHVFSYGTAKPDSIFEIGSITKTFTGLLLAQMVEQGKVKFDEPVRELLPAGTVAKPAGSEITLIDLATQHSGLPRMPDNFKPADSTNPYADYRAADLYAFLTKHGVAKPADATFLYSNLGFGLLGQALVVRSGVTYPELLKNEITGPLGMKDTVVALSAEQQLRFIAGHDGAHHPAHAWDLVAFAGAGAIRSTADDMLTYLQANLHPDKLPFSATKTPSGQTLPAALAQSHEVRADAMAGMRITLAWLYVTSTGSYWHNGGTGGYSSFAFFNPRTDYAAVVLVNTSGDFADRLGQHIGQRLAGKPAILLGTGNDKDTYDRAIQNYDEAIRLDPKSASAFAGRGSAYFDKGNYDHAIQDFNEAIRLNPKSAIAFNGRGASYFAKGDYDRAIQDYNEAIRLDPKTPRALLNRGLVNLYSGHFSDAQQDFSENFRLDQTDLYSAIWLYLSQAKAGTDGKDGLKANTAGLNLSKWPGPVIQLYLGQSTPEDALRAAGSDSDQRCEYSFYVGEYRALRGERPEALALFGSARDGCPKDFIEYSPTLIELKDLEKQE